MATKRVKEIANALKAAKAAAENARRENDEDGGTCNLDSPAFRVERCREETIIKAAVLAGVDVCSFSWYGTKWFWVNVTEGQGNLRCRMARAATAALKSLEVDVSGLRASCYYAMD